MEADKDFLEVNTATKDSIEYHILQGRIKGAALSWKKIKVNGKTILTPCYTFRAMMKIENGEEALDEIVVPRLEKYFDQ